jgi:hypothetical protein
LSRGDCRSDVKQMPHLERRVGVSLAIGAMSA